MISYRFGLVHINNYRLELDTHTHTHTHIHTKYTYITASNK